MPTHSFADRRRGSRHARGYGAAWDKLRLSILARDQHVCRCSTCTAMGRVRPATEVDHITPKYAGGTDDPGNLQAINTDCHKAKTQLEALAARGITEQRPSKACAADGVPTDPRHHWARG
jgi:5-methylcytosine-specific restriction protein A